MLEDRDPLHLEYFLEHGLRRGYGCDCEIGHDHDSKNHYNEKDD